MLWWCLLITENIMRGWLAAVELEVAVKPVVCLRVCLYACLCVCMCSRICSSRIGLHAHQQIYLYIHIYTVSLVYGDVYALQPPTPSSFRRPVSPLSAIELSASLQPVRGTACHQPPFPLLHSKFSDNAWKLNFFRAVSCHLTFRLFASTLFNSSYLAISPTLLGVLAVTLWHYGT